MQYKLLLVALLMLTLTNSCAEKQQEVIAINVLLTLPDDVYHEALKLNGKILEDHPDNIILDENHIPHITLLQCYVKASDLPKIEKSLKPLYNTIKNNTLWVDKLQYTKGKNESFASMGITKIGSLMELHQKIITLLEPYKGAKGTQQSYIQNADGTPIDEFTINYVPKFLSAHSFENYNPHISLGVAKISLLDSLAQHNFRAMKFRATSISVYQLGAFGTAQKLLWESE